MCGEESFAVYKDRVKADLNKARRFVVLFIFRSPHSLFLYYSDAELTESAIRLYENFLKTATLKHDCPLCDRGFPNDHDLSVFIAKVRITIIDILVSQCLQIKGYIDKFPDRKTDTAMKLKEAERNNAR